MLLVRNKEPEIEDTKEIRRCFFLQHPNYLNSKLHTIAPCREHFLFVLPFLLYTTFFTFVTVRKLHDELFQKANSRIQ